MFLPEDTDRNHEDAHISDFCAYLRFGLFGDYEAFSHALVAVQDSTHYKLAKILLG